MNDERGLTEPNHHVDLHVGGDVDSVVQPDHASYRAGIGRARSVPRTALPRWTGLAVGPPSYVRIAMPSDVGGADRDASLAQLTTATAHSAPCTDDRHRIARPYLP